MKLKDYLVSSLEFSKAKDAELAWINGLIALQDNKTDVNPMEEDEDHNILERGTKHTYRIYPKYWDTLTQYHTCAKFWMSPVHYLLMCVKTAGLVANSVDPDQMPGSISWTCSK